MNKTVFEINEKQIIFDNELVGGKVSFKQDIPVFVDIYFQNGFDENSNFSLYIRDGSTVILESLVEVLTAILNEMPKEDK